MDLITAKIDVLKITKSKLYKGEKGTYLNVTLVPTPNSQHSDYMIVEETTKEERDAGEKGVILGNAKIKKPKADTSCKVDAEGITPDENLPF